MQEKMNDEKSTSENQEMEVNKLAFIGLKEVETGVFRGGALVTNQHGKPLEFRCTTAIKPTSVQKTLYGGTLHAHICVELIARPLFTALQEDPDVIIAKEADFIELRPSVEDPLLIVAKQGESFATEEKISEKAKKELLDSQSGRFEPITLTTHWQYHQDVACTLPNLRNMFARFDLIEPFSRIDNALALLHEKGVFSDGQ